MKSPDVRMFSAATSLLASTAVTSGLGFLFWIVAARIAPVDQVAAATAIVSAMTLLANVGRFGFGTMLIGEAVRAERQLGPAVATSLTVVTGTSVLLTGGFILGAQLLDSTLSRALDDWSSALALVIGVALGAAGLVLDEALIGKALGRVQLNRNVVFSASKLVFCWAIAAVVEVTTAGTILWAWVAGSLLSLAFTAIELTLRNHRIFHLPRRSAMAGLGARTADHSTINLAQMAPRLGLPILASIVLIESEYAAFFAAWMIASFLYMLPTHTSTAMFSIAIGDRASLARRLRTALVVLLVPGTALAIAAAASASLLLGLFGDDYGVAGIGLAVLAAGYLPCVLKEMYIAVERVEGRLRPAGLILLGAAAVELTAGTIGGAFAGIEGAALGYILGTCLLSITYVRSITAALTSPIPAAVA